MKSLDEFKEGYCEYMLRELPYNWLQAGIAIDRMTLSNISKSTKKINYYLERLLDEFVEFIRLLDKEVRRRKVKDKGVNDIIIFFKETAEKVEKFRHHVKNIIPSLKKKEMEVPGERKRIEDEKNFKAAKQELKDRYTRLDYILEKKGLEEDFEELEKVFAHERDEEKLVIEAFVKKLKRFSRTILHYAGISFSTFEKRYLLAQIDIYVKDLTEFSQKIPQEGPLLLDIKGEIQIWKNVRRNLKKTTAENYEYLKAQLLKLLKDDKKLFKRIEAA